MNNPAYATAGTDGMAQRGKSLSEAGPSTAERSAWKAVYCIAERGKGRRLWLRIGTAFPNRDGSLTIRLDAMPLSGQLQVRDPFIGGSRDSESEPLPLERPLKRDSA